MVFNDQMMLGMVADGRRNCRVGEVGVTGRCCGNQKYAEQALMIEPSVAHRRGLLSARWQKEWSSRARTCLLGYDQLTLGMTNWRGVLVNPAYDGRAAVTIVESGKANRLEDAGGLRSTLEVYSPIT